MVFSLLFIYNTYSQDFDRFQILGTWKFVATKTSINDSNKLATSLCSVCPDINFNSARFAKVSFPDGEIQIFLFKIESNKLTLRPTFDNTKPFLDDTYLVKIKNNSDSLEMELKQKKLSYTYILRKKLTPTPTPVKRGPIQK